MKTYQEMSRGELLKEKAALEAAFEKIKARGLALDMSRGKPGADQLDLCNCLWQFQPEYYV